jgi:hypothetical protein
MSNFTDPPSEKETSLLEKSNITTYQGKNLRNLLSLRTAGGLNSGRRF